MQRYTRQLEKRASNIIKNLRGFSSGFVWVEAEWRWGAIMHLEPLIFSEDNKFLIAVWVKDITWTFQTFKYSKFYSNFETKFFSNLGEKPRDLKVFSSVKLFYPLMKRSHSSTRKFLPSIWRWKFSHLKSSKIFMRYLLGCSSYSALNWKKDWIISLLLSALSL